MLKLRKGNAASILVENVTELEKWSETALQHVPHYPLLKVLAEALDSAAKGQNIYLIIGATKDRSAVSVTVKQDGGGDARYGATLGDVSIACHDWL